MAAGVRQRHGNRCTGTGRCDCPWRAEVYSQADEKKIRKAFPTKAAAVAWRNDSTTAVRQKVMRAPTATTVREASKDWLDGAREGRIRTRSGDSYKPAALRSYEASLRLRVLPVFGSRKLSDVTRADVQDLADRLLAEGLSPSGINGTMNPLRAIYRRALMRPDSGVVVNPTAGLALPAIRGGRDRIASPEECERLLQALPARDRALWACAMFAGLRRGELQALRIEDVNLAAGVIDVRRGWDAKAGEIPTKNRQSRRVPIPAALRDYLDERVLAAGWSEGLLFGTGASTPFGNAIDYRARQAWKKAKLARITLHECRHGYASLMIAAGVNAKALSDYMGHASITITMDRYGHLMPGNEIEAAGLLDAYLERADTAARLAQIA